MHTLKVAILDMSAESEAFSFDDFCDDLAVRVLRVPFLRWKLQTVPFGAGQPFWVEDYEFDLTKHVHRLMVPPPVTDTELGEVIANIAMIRLNRSRPLWEIHVIEGLPDGRVATITKAHHALADDVTWVQIMDTYYDAVPRNTQPRGRGVSPTSIPRLVARCSLANPVTSVHDLLRNYRHQVPNLVRIVCQARALRRQSSRDAVPLLSAPRTPFTRALHAHRAFAFGSMSLNEIHTIRRVLGGTVNDVILTLATGAFRRYLSRLSRLPEDPLIAGIAISTHSATNHDLFGNHVAGVRLRLPTHVSDQMERFETIRQEARQAIAYARQQSIQPADILAAAPPALIVIATSSYRLLKQIGLRSFANATVSDVIGPTQPLYCGLARVDHLYSVGPLFEGTAINLTVWSYCDELNFALLVDPSAVTQVWTLFNDLRVELALLASLAQHG